MSIFSPDVSTVGGGASETPLPDQERINKLFPIQLYKKPERSEQNVQSETGMEVIREEEPCNQHEKVGLLLNKNDVKIGGEANLDSYQRVPISDFGKSMLAK